MFGNFASLLKGVIFIEPWAQAIVMKSGQNMCKEYGKRTG